ncbi:MAG: UPF0365 family protein, partial [Chlamydiia bacterium]
MKQMMLAEIDMGLGFTLIVFIMAILVLILFTMTARFLSLWFQAFVSGTPVALFSIVGMSLRK